MEEIREIRASGSRGKPMYMRDWSEKLDAFLKFNEQGVLQNSGKVSHEVAVAEKEYKSFHVEQDKWFESDFDRVVKKYLLKMQKISDYKNGCNYL